ncbi:MAG TPA: NAD(P)/FAD-dependent oxidoreductase [bacterium]|nr:NAD(P)/FAD-dependent oxidoreductase [bacterium]
MTERMFDAAIVGAGPAGATVAHRLAQAGANVVVFDHSHPREKPCGGGISARARTMFPELDELAALGKSGTRLRLVSPAGRVTVVEGGGNTFAIDRAILDAQLLARAVDAGARHEAQKVLAVEKQADGWRVTTSAGAVRAKTLIGADGVFSPVRRALLGPIPRAHLAFGAHALVERLDPPSALLQFFGDRRGYAWIFNRKEKSSLGVGMPDARKGDWRVLLQRLINEQAPGHSPSIRGWLLPQASSEAAFAAKLGGDDWCVIGDAAGHVDPFTGEGILYAMWGARIAAECLQSGGLAAYDARWREEFLPRLLKHLKMSALLERGYLLEAVLAAGRLPLVGAWLYGALTSAD